MKDKKSKYRMCPYCGRYVPADYNFNEHKKICKNVYSEHMINLNKQER